MTAVLLYIFIYLSAAVITVPLSKKLGLGSVLGYLIAGVFIGPTLGLVGKETETIQHVAEFGVVMMLFLVGLELEPSKLWKLRSKLLGLGGLQVMLTAAAIAFLAYLCGVAWQSAVTIGCIFSLSSTAIVLQTLGEKNLLSSPGGQSSFSVLLFQDIAVIPMLALLPLLALPELTNSTISVSAHSSLNLLEHASAITKTVITTFAISVIIVAGHYLARPVFRYIASTRSQEIFIFFALTLVVGIALLMSLIGLSPALGTFLAGVVLANNEYRHALESTLEPFKGLLLGLFFITVGASIQFGLLFSNFFLIIGLTLAIIVIKFVVLFLLGKAFRLKGLDTYLFALSLAQAGEFGFVLLTFGVQNALISQEYSDILLLVVTLSMVFAPLLFILYDKVLIPRFHKKGERQQDTIEEANPILVLGHGRFGQVVNGILNSCGYPTTIIDHDPHITEGMSMIGVKTYFGDASQPTLLEAAGVKDAKLVVVAIDNQEQTLQIVHYLHQHFPELPVVARAYDRRAVYNIYQEDIGTAIVRETFDSAVRAGRYALEKLGIETEKAKMLAQLFFERNRTGLKHLAEYYDPEIEAFKNKALIYAAKQYDQETAALLQALIANDGLLTDETTKEELNTDFPEVENEYSKNNDDKSETAQEDKSSA
ncbi:Kef-type potassium/proton antiporter (CPA2 family) [Cricetibacter osteomyelitidis]|uniref:Kef-type potassium/proton antiporter (CPA2 family) n=1 Tax=Cricetibacter osteomyelitidis TaxID=1521931 RepID=A0A4R2TJJ0_9PAST|nr:monovalent cation:proton antiporter-2 (CPA2) family protein [Cricetibacter osteomyelitidis]TCP94982.1 Kef-type potassium/proton antiporter (CPA2 family) [Cricetibacter osteomyelitidis]